MLDKKYFSITELAELTKLPIYKLRYVEKSNPRFEVVQIRNRRYYTVDNIEFLLQNYHITVSHELQQFMQAHGLATTAGVDQQQFIDSINELIGKFQRLIIEMQNV